MARMEASTLPLTAVPPEASLVEPHSAKLAAACARVHGVNTYDRAGVRQAQVELAEVIDTELPAAQASVDTELAELKDNIVSELHRVAAELVRMQELVNVQTWLASRGTRRFVERPLAARAGGTGYSLLQVLAMLQGSVTAIATPAAKKPARSRR